MAGIAPYEESTDSFGYAWLTRRTTPTDLAGLIGDVQAISSRIEAAGHGSSLLCAVVVFNDRTEQSLGMIYLFKRGTWYPFAPTGKDARDNTRELEVKAALGDTLRVDPDLARWFPVWDAPGL